MESLKMLIYHLLAHKSFPLIPLKIQPERCLTASPRNNDHLAKGLKNQNKNQNIVSLHPVISGN